MDAKQIHERDVFVEFARAANLRVDVDSIESRQPPEPDVLCCLAGQMAYFEFGRLLDEGMQRVRLRAMKEAPNLVPMDVEYVKLPEREMLRKKLAKQYDCSGRPVDLVLYYDTASPLVGDVPVWDESQWPWHAEHVMVPLISASPTVFSTIWVFDRHRCKILWSHTSRPEPGAAPDPAGL
jgi:hypothetical protein